MVDELHSKTIMNRVKSFAQDNDTALSVSSLEEYYLDSGALFNVIVCNAITLAENDSIEVEFFANDATVRLFNYFISTLSDEYNLVFYELNERVLDSSWVEGEDEDYRETMITKLNRTKLENDLPIDVAFLQDGTGGGEGAGQKYDIDCWEDTEYTEGDYVRHKGIVYTADTAITGDATSVEPQDGDWTKVGEVIATQQLRLEGVGGPQSADQGDAVERSTTVRFNTKQKNYLLEIENLDAATKDFGLSALMGVSEFLMHN